MKYEKYAKLAIEAYPNMQFDKIVHTSGWNKVDLVKNVAELLFIDREVDSLLAKETRKQLISLKEFGEHCFK